MYPLPHCTTVFGGNATEDAAWADYVFPIDIEKLKQQITQHISATASPEEISALWGKMSKMREFCEFPRATLGQGKWWEALTEVQLVALFNICTLLSRGNYQYELTPIGPFPKQPLPKHLKGLASQTTGGSPGTRLYMEKGKINGVSVRYNPFLRVVLVRGNMHHILDYEKFQAALECKPCSPLES
eukprot:TRINITY_DN70485_c0_g1_i1.p1 TRINITY_DN70485_c0_g1~~TRINITY_DN70485_c0_g1_i1.p1  ORF type:complete len:186 (-),score=12.62 TRINITY_DN70485_c0_g1_i1:85-642(-)